MRTDKNDEGAIGTISELLQDCMLVGLAYVAVNAQALMNQRPVRSAALPIDSMMSCCR